MCVSVKPQVFLSYMLIIHIFLGATWLHPPLKVFKQSLLPKSRRA